MLSNYMNASNKTFQRIIRFQDTKISQSTENKLYNELWLKINLRNIPQFQYFVLKYKYQYESVSQDYVRAM